MKAVKISAIVIGALVALAVILIGLALTPSVQTWAVRKAVAGQPGIAIEVGQISAGLSSARVSDLRVVQDGVVLTAASITADYSAWDYLLHGRVNVDQASIHGLVVDLRSPTVDASAVAPSTASGQGAAAPSPGRPQDAAASPTPAHPPFDGLLNLAHLPLDIRLGTLAVEGRALLPENREVNLDLHGGNIAVGGQGQLEWKIDFTDSDKTAPVRAVRTTGSIALRITTDRRVDLVEVQVIASPEGPQLPPDRIRLNLKAEQAAAGANELYTLQGTLIRAEKSEPLFDSNLTYEAAAHQLVGTWHLAVQSDQFGSLLAGLGLPDVALDGSGKFTLQPDTSAIASSGELRAGLSRLEHLSPALAAVGAIRVQAAFDGSVAKNIAHLDRLELDAKAADGRTFVEVAVPQKISFNLQSQRIDLADPTAEVARLTLTDVPLAWAQPMAKPLTIDGGDLSMILAIGAEADGSHLHVRTVSPVTLRNVSVSDSGKKLVDQVTLVVSPDVDYTAHTIVAELAELRISTPAGDTVSGRASARISSAGATPAVGFSASLQAKLVSLLQPYLPLDPGPLAVATDLAGQLDGQVLKLEKESTRVTRADGTVLLAAEVLQPLTIDLKAGSVAATNAASPAARLRLGEIPLTWAESFVPKSALAGSFGGATFEVSVSGPDDLALRSVEPLTLRGLGVTIDGKELARGLDLAVELDARKHGPTIAYDVRKLEVSEAAGSLMKLNVAGEATPGAHLAVSAKGGMSADLVGLLKQPALAPFATLARGQATASFDVTMADAILAQVTVAVRDLVALQGNQPLGNIDLNIDAGLKADGSGTIKLPLTLTVAGRRSDLAIAGSFAHTKTKISFNGGVTSNQMVADDFQALAALAPTSSTPPPVSGAKPVARSPASTASSTSSASSAPAVAPVADTSPFWSGASGRFELDLKKILYGKDYTISGVHAIATVDDHRLALDPLEGKFKDTPFKVSAAITFNAGQARPYALSGGADVTAFDVGAFLRAANPGEPPALESKVSVKAKLAGTGATLDDVIQNITGQFDVTGSSGVLRALGRKGGAVNTLSKVVGLIGAIKGSDTTVAVADLAAAMNEMKFDQLSAHVERGADLNLKLTALEFLSPAMRITGTGVVEHRAGLTIDEQPLQLQIQLAGKEHMATLLNRLRLLSGQKDDKGYDRMNRPFVVKGTLAKPDANQLWTIVGEAAASGLLR